MQVIIANSDGTNQLQIHVPDDIWQKFAKGEYSEIIWPIDSGPMPRMITFRHDFS